MDKNTAIFALSSDIDTNLKFKILSIEGQFKHLFSQSARISNPKLCQHLSKLKYTSDLFITVQLFDGNAPLTLPVQTTYVSFDYNNDQDPKTSTNSGSGGSEDGSTGPSGPAVLPLTPSSNRIGGSNSYKRNFNQWINLPINYSQLPITSKLVFKIYEFVNNERKLFGQCEISLFDQVDMTLKKGHQLIQVKLDDRFNQLDNFGGIKKPKNSNSKEEEEKYQSQLKDLENIIKKLETINCNSSNHWINSLIIKKIEKMNKTLIKKNLDNFNLYIELVNFDVSIIYNDFVYSKDNYAANNINKNLGGLKNINESLLTSKNNSLNSSLLVDNRRPNRNRATKYVNNTSNRSNRTNNNKSMEQPIDIDSINQNAKYSVSKVFDPEQYNNQPIELKYHQLERSSLNNSNYKKLTDRNLKPNLKLKKHLNKILSYSSIKKLENYERNLIYKFRYYLINNFKLNSSLNSNFLNFLLKSINWENTNEVIEIQEILNSLRINKLQISLTNNLELLGPLFSSNTLVRNFAVDNLKYFDDSELNLYLLQLIQALKFDDYIFDGNYLSSSTSDGANNTSINFDSLNNSNDFSVVDVSSKEELSTLFKTLKYNKRSGPFNVHTNNENNGGSSNTGGAFNDAYNRTLDGNGRDKFHFDNFLSPLANLLIYKAIHNKRLGNFFYWYIKIESRDTENDFKSQLIFKKIVKVFLKHLKELQVHQDAIDKMNERRNKIDKRLISRNNSIDSDINELDSSEDQIGDRAPAANTHPANTTVSKSDDYYRTIKNNVNKIFDTTASTSGANNANGSSAQLRNDNNIVSREFELSGNELKLSELQEQINFVKKISQLTLSIKNLKKTTPEKQEFLKSFLAKNESGYRYFDPKNKKPLTLPLSPGIQILHIIPESCTVFKSSLSPLKLTFKILVTEEDELDEDDDSINREDSTYSFMYKVGDDLRQDQLIIQIIKLIEKLLKDENLNLKLNPYKILATDLNEGMIEFVPNLTLDKILNQYTNILNFFRTENPFGKPQEQQAKVAASTAKKQSENVVKDIGNIVLNANTDLESNIAEAINDNSNSAIIPGISSDNNNLSVDGIHPKIMDNFVKSCAGYCVITYLLGIGDRHLDNLLICNNGKFFHVDFGYILGRDPKPFPPLMKLPIEIIEGFGGLNSSYFVEFKNYCYICFLTLRKNSNLILNLLELMTNCNIPDLKVDTKNAISKVQDKFMLELTDEEAIVYFQNLINDSVNAFLPVVIDKLHSLAQYWRS